MSDTKTPDTKTETPTTAEPGGPKLLKVGDVVRLRAVHGYIQDPFTLEEFDTDKEKKVVANGWTVVQHEAGKLVVSE